MTRLILKDGAGSVFEELVKTIDSHGRRYRASNADKGAGLTDVATVLALADALAGSMSLLQRLPGMDDNAGLDALHDLLCALHTLAEGGQPSLFRVDVKGSGQDTMSRRFIKYNAVLCTAVLIEAGLQDKTARDFVAKAFTDAGHRGRKGGALSSKTIFEWMGECGKGGPDINGEEWLKQQLERWRAELKQQLERRCADPTRPSPLALTKEWVRRHAASPLLVTKI